MGTILLHQNGAGDVKVTVSLVSPPLKFVNTGLDSVIDFNITGSPTITVDHISNSIFQLTGGGVAGAHHFDGFGDFEYALDIVGLGQGAGSAQSSPLSFDVHAAGLLESSFTGSSKGTFWGVDVINTSTGRTGPIGTGDSGTVTTTSSVPEPASIFLFGTLAVGIASFCRKKLV
jgi:hypothetical protein